VKPALPPSTSAKAREDVAGEDDARRRALLKKLLRGHTGKRFKRPRLRTVLLLINLVVLVLPLAGIAMLVLPGPGWLAIFGGLAILATEFAWARWMLKHARERMTQLAEKYVGSSAAAGAAPRDSSKST